MSKKSLYKIFYADYKNYFSEFEKRFNDEDTFHLDISIGEYPAFICQTPEIFNLIISIERTNGIVNTICEKLPKIALSQFQTRCLIDEIVLTNKIEGVYSTRKEINDILLDLSKRSKKTRFYGLVNKYMLLVKDNDIDLEKSEHIRKIYDDIFYDEIKETDFENLPDGKIFRKNSVGVYSASGKELHKGLSPETKIIDTMNKALDFLNDPKYDYLIRIAVFHYLFGYIHPFYDGNGRTSRFISSYLLSKKLNKLIGYRISYTIKENISKYYEAFKVCNHNNSRGELTPFIEMFLRIVDISMKQLYESLQEKMIRLQHYENKIELFCNMSDVNAIELYDILIQASLFSNNGITQAELQDVLGVTYNTVSRRLKKIPEELLIINRDGKHSLYLLNLNEIDKMSI